VSMLMNQFDLINCSWPRPIEQRNGQWISEPEWDAPQMAVMPQPKLQCLNGEWCWTIDWREFFRGGIKPWDPAIGGEMRGFHVIFRICINVTGTLIFWDDDGSIIRQHGQCVHVDKTAHMLTRHELKVEKGEVLEIAQWQHVGGWIWGARLDTARSRNDETLADLLGSYLEVVQEKLQTPNGPPLKLFTHGGTPGRAVTAVYSMILNGYVPSAVLLYGDYQWNHQAHNFFSRLLPFGQVVPTAEVLNQIRAVGSATLVDWAKRYWFVHKACIAVLHAPDEFCLIDDDIFILDPVQDALDAFQGNDLVFAPDTNHGPRYQIAWRSMLNRGTTIGTGTFNAGLYWARNHYDKARVAASALAVHPGSTPAYVWEQGFIASLYAGGRSFQLSTQRYFYPLFDGLPCGRLGYDYAQNPCGFVSVHFGGLAEKPCEEHMFDLAPQVLGRGLTKTCELNKQIHETAELCKCVMIDRL